MDRLSMAREWEKSAEGQQYIQANRAPQPEPGYGEWLQAGITANPQNADFQQSLIQELMDYNNPQNQKAREDEERMARMEEAAFYIDMGMNTGDKEMQKYGADLLQDVGGYGAGAPGASDSGQNSLIQDTVNQTLQSQYQGAAQESTGDELRFNTAMDEYLGNSGTMERGYSANYDTKTGDIYKQPEVSGAAGDMISMALSGDTKGDYNKIMKDYRDSLGFWDRMGYEINPFGKYEKPLEYSQRTNIGNINE